MQSMSAVYDAKLDPPVVNPVIDSEVVVGTDGLQITQLLPPVELCVYVHIGALENAPVANVIVQLPLDTFPIDEIHELV